MVNIYSLQQIIQQIHPLGSLLEVGTSVDIQREGYVLMSEYFGKRLDIEFRDFDSSDGKCVPDLVEFHLLQTVSFDKSCKELTVGSRLGRLALACQ